MAIKLRVNGDPVKKGPPKKVKVKVVRKDEAIPQDSQPTLPPITKDPAIKGPIGFLTSYYDSPEFEKRHIERNAINFDRTGMNLGRKYFGIQKGQSDIGSHSVSVNELMNWGKDNIPAGAVPTVFLDSAQAKYIKSDLLHDTVPHEFTHTTRGLNIAEEKDFIDKNKNLKYAKMYPYDKYLQEGWGNAVRTNRMNNAYSEFLNSKNRLSHDEQPSENYADLNSLRWMMYKQGIYDTRKGPMTIDHLQKAMKDPWLKEQFGLKRLLKTFKPEDIVTLNNTIAMNDKKEGTENVT